MEECDILPENELPPAPQELHLTVLEEAYSDINLKCFLCNEPQAPSRFYQNLFIEHLIPNLIGEKKKILRIFCQILHVKWELIEGVFDSGGSGELPFCETCSENMMRLISLREKLFLIQSQMSDGIRYIREMIAKEINANSESAAKSAEPSFREHFRSEVYEEYVSRELLVFKIEEHNTTKRVEEHVIEVEPSLVQLNLGIFETSPDNSKSTNLQRQKSKAVNISLNSKIISKLKTPNASLKTTSSNSFKKPTRASYSLRNIEKTDEKKDQIEIKNEPIENDVVFEENVMEYGGENNAESSIDISNDVENLKSNNDDDESYSNEMSDSRSVDSDFTPSKTRSGRKIKAKNRIGGSLKKTKPKISSDDKEKERLEENKTVGKRKRRSSDSFNWDIPSEKFSELIEEESGKVFYEGIEIIRTNLTLGMRQDYILTCSKCGEKIDFSKGQNYKKGSYRLMQIHIKRYHLDAYKCKICGKNLSEHRIYHKHMIRRHGPKRKEKKFTVPEDVELDSDGKMYYNTTEIIKISKEDGEYDLMCSLCSKVFNSDKIQKDRQTPIRRLIYHIRGSHMKVFKCKECNKSYADVRALRCHVNSKHTTDPQLFLCEICQKPLKVRKHVKNHMWSHYNAEERAAAIASGQKEPLTYSKMISQRREQGKDKSFQCSECGKTFEMLCNLKRHEHVHWQEKNNHQCPHCGKFYCTLESLTSHIKYIHETERVHKKYPCDFCEKRFTSKSPYLKHRRTHTKELPFSCPKCLKPYALKQSMDRHAKSCVPGKESSSRSKKRKNKNNANRSENEGSGSEFINRREDPQFSNKVNCPPPGLPLQIQMDEGEVGGSSSCNLVAPQRGSGAILGPPSIYGNPVTHFIGNFPPHYQRAFDDGTYRYDNYL